MSKPYRFSCSICDTCQPFEGKRKLQLGRLVAWACRRCTHKFTTDEMYAILKGEQISGEKTRAAYHSDYHREIRPLKRLEAAQ